MKKQNKKDQKFLLFYQILRIIMLIALWWSAFILIAHDITANHFRLASIATPIMLTANIALVVLMFTKKQIKTRRILAVCAIAFLLLGLLPLFYVSDGGPSCCMCADVATNYRNYYGFAYKKNGVEGCLWEQN